jgi:hypothetical protein
MQKCILDLCQTDCSTRIPRRIISPSVYHGKIIFSRKIRLSNVTLLLIHNCVCKRKNGRIHCNPNNGYPSTKTLPEIRPVWFGDLASYKVAFEFEIRALTDI